MKLKDKIAIVTGGAMGNADKLKMQLIKLLQSIIKLIS